MSDGGPMSDGGAMTGSTNAGGEGLGADLERITLVCLDMAGTTVADDGTVEAAFLAAMTSSGVTDDVELERALAYVRETMGRSKIDVFRHLADGDLSQAQLLNVRFESAYADIVARGDVAAMPGAREALDELRADGRATCLTTGFAPATRDAILDALGWWDAVDLALSPADAGRGRPWPDMILTAVLRLGIDAVQAVAVAGDTTSDLESGTRAGAGVVAGVLTGAHDRDRLASAPHTHLLSSVTELPALLRIQSAR